MQTIDLVMLLLLNGILIGLTFRINLYRVKVYLLFLLQAYNSVTVTVQDKRFGLEPSIVRLSDIINTSLIFTYKRLF